MPLEAFSAMFRPHVDELFTIRFTDATVEMRLAQVVVAPSANAPRPSGAPFRLYFLGSPDMILPQRTYIFEHAILGELPIFIVLLGAEPAGMRYEAVFN